MSRWLARLLESSAPRSTILVRLVVGAVFVSEGTQKFLEPGRRGVGRFEKIGIPWPELMGPLVGTTEIACGAVLLAGLLTRLAALPLIGIMGMAIVSTKIPILLGRGFWGFNLRELSSYGFWSMAHEARTDFAMLGCSIFLLIVGAGPWSVDARLVQRGRP
jgi:putative oxidoreductase